MKAALQQVLAPLFGDDVAVENLRPLTGGASRATYAFDADSGGLRRPLILRTGAADDSGHYAGMELEAAVQAAAAESGAPVPRVLVASDSPAPLGSPFLICDEVAGETIVRKIQRQLDEPGRHSLLVQCAQALAAIHRARADAPGLAEQDQIAEYRLRLDEMDDTTATFEWAFRWLAEHRPAESPDRKRLVHGDFRMGNLIVEGSTLAAVLDWELVHIGEIYEDLAWFCIRAWRFGAGPDRAAGGLGGIEEFVRAYQDSGGAPVDPQTLHWWIVLATLRWGVICRLQAERHLSGQTRSVELAAVGRRVCETEWDLLDLLGAPEIPGEQPPDAPVAPPGLHGRPTAAELVAAVAEFLDSEVRQATTGAVNFHALVAANALRIVERELSVPDGQAARAALHTLGYRDERSLAAAIRAGAVDGRDAEVLAGLRAVVGHRLAVAHPTYSDPPANPKD